MSFRWNEPGAPQAFWDEDREVVKPGESPLAVVKSPQGRKVEYLIYALCEVVAELAELEEQRFAYEELAMREAKGRDPYWDRGATTP